MKKALLILSTLILFFPGLLSAQNDTMYIMKSGEAVGVYLVNEVDSIIFYKPEGFTPTVEDIDGNSYGFITLGTQVWMTENLKTTRFNDGSYISLVTDGSTWEGMTTDGYCWFDNDQATYENLYGALYNWYAANSGNLCPSGWHVPTDAEWKTLEIFLGMDESTANTAGWRGLNEGSKLAGHAELWMDGSLETDSQFGASGFDAVPAGCRHVAGAYDSDNINGYFWSAGEASADYAFIRGVGFSVTSMLRLSKLKYTGYSVRCVKDSE